MQQVIMTEPGKIRVKNIDGPSKPINNQVLLKIKRIGICGSDIHVYHGEHPAVIYPVVQGHEYSAVVEAVGSEVKDIKPGMRVTARPQQVCGKCKQCLRGDYNVCDNLKVEGFQAPGAGQEFFIVPENRIIVLPESVSFEKGAMVEPTAVAVHSSGRAGDLRGKNVVVSGAGTIGNLVAQYALKVRKAKNVVITDISNYRLEVAKKSGIEHTINVKEQSFDQEIKKCFKGEGFQVAMEAAGVSASLSLLVEKIDKGGTIVIIGVYAKNPEVNMYYLGEHELNLVGSLMYLHEDYQAAVDAIEKNKIMLEPLISKHFPLTSFREAYGYIEEKKDKILKVMIDV